MESLLERELWTSWASCLRSYAAVHGMSSTHHAVVEVSSESILLRVDARWVRFYPTRPWIRLPGRTAVFGLHEDGTVEIDGTTEDMDLAAREGRARASARRLTMR